MKIQQLLLRAALCCLTFLLVGSPAGAALDLATVSLGAPSITPGGNSLLTVTLRSAGPSTNLRFSTTLPPNVTVAGFAENTCGGNLEATVGQRPLALSGGARLGANDSCHLAVWITSSSVGTHALPAIEVFDDEGSTSSTTLNLTVREGTRFSVALEPSGSLGFRNLVTLTYTFEAGASAAARLAFSQNLSGVVDLVPELPPSTTCDFTTPTLTPSYDSDSITFWVNGFAGFFELPAGDSCQVVLQGFASSVGDHWITSSQAMVDAVAVGEALTHLEVLATQVSSELELAGLLHNPGARVPATLTLRAFDRTDPVEALGLTWDVASDLPGSTVETLASNCGSPSLTGGSSLILSGGQIPAQGSCQVTFELVLGTALSPNSYVLAVPAPTGTLRSQALNSSTGASTLLSVGPAPRLSWSSPSVIFPGSTSRWSFTLTNTSPTLAATNAGFTLDLNSLQTGLSPGQVNVVDSGDCSLTTNVIVNQRAELIAGGGHIATGATCTVLVDITFGDNSAPLAPSFPLAQATLDGSVWPAVIDAGEPALLIPAVRVTLSADPYEADSTALVAVRLELPADAPSDAEDITLSWDTSGLSLVGAPLSDVCGTGSSLSVVADEVVLSEATLSPGGTCDFSLPLAIPAAPEGSYLLSLVSGQATLEYDGPKLVPLSGDDLTLEIAAPIQSSARIVQSVLAPGEDATLELSLSNSGAHNATDLFLTWSLNTFGSGVVASSLPTSPCGGTMTGTNFIIWTGASIATGETCTVQIPLTVPSSLGIGHYTSSSSAPSVSYDGAPLTLAPLSARFDIENPLLASTRFESDWAPVGGTTDWIVELTNQSTSLSITDIGFNLPLDASLAGLSYTGGATSSCSGSFTGDTALSFDAGALAPQATCTLSVPLQLPASAAPGTTLQLISNDLSGLINAVMLPPSTLYSTIPLGGVGLTVRAPSGVLEGGTATLEVELESLTNSPVANLALLIDVTELYPDAAISGPLEHSCEGTVRLAGEIGTATVAALDSLQLGAGSGCTLLIPLQLGLGTVPADYEGSFGPVTKNGLPTSLVATAKSSVLLGNELFTASLDPQTGDPGDVFLLTFVLDNTEGVFNDAELGFTLDLPGDLAIATDHAASSECTESATMGGAASSTPVNGSWLGDVGASSLSLEAATLAEGERCELTVGLVSVVGGRLEIPAVELSGISPTLHTASLLLDISTPDEPDPGGSGGSGSGGSENGTGGSDGSAGDGAGASDSGGTGGDADSGDEKSGCGCHVGPNNSLSSPGALWALLLLILPLWRRRAGKAHS